MYIRPRWSYSVAVDPELVQLVLARVAEQAEAVARHPDPPVVLPQAGPAGAERLDIPVLPESLQPRSSLSGWQPVECRELLGVGHEGEVVAQVAGDTVTGSSRRPIVEQIGSRAAHGEPDTRQLQGRSVRRPSSSLVGRERAIGTLGAPEPRREPAPLEPADRVRDLRGCGTDVEQGGSDFLHQPRRLHLVGQKRLGGERGGGDSRSSPALGGEGEIVDGPLVPRTASLLGPERPWEPSPSWPAAA